MKRLAVVTVGASVGLGLVVGGPVGAVVASVYGALAARGLLRRESRRRARSRRVAVIAELAGLAADLRAGVPVYGLAVPGEGRVARLASSVWRLAERTGAPAADLVERIEADARAADRAAASAAAQAAGSQVTGVLLAGLPLAGVALGRSMGAQPLDVLFHTPVGAGCAIASAVLQGGGVLWIERLATGVAR